MKRIFFLLTLFCLPVATIAQSGQNFIPKIIKPAPTVAGLLKYVEVPVTNYNGTTQFSIPIYNVKEADIDLPISLSYSGNGLKTDEEAGWVGLGWNLNVGGVIQFVQQIDLQSENIAPRGIELNPVYESDNQTNVAQRGCTYQTANGDPITFSNDSSIKYYGYEYPLYIYNFNGYSGKCISTPNNIFINLDKSNVKFERLPSPDNGFKATTPDGMQYYFEDAGRGQSQKLNYSAPCSGFIEIQSITTSPSYNLTKIISPLNQIITFTYTSVSSYSLPALSQWYTNDIYATETSFFTSTYSSHTEKVLTEINTATTKIKFISSARDDIYQGKKLDKIEVYRQGEVTALKTINFTTDYFVGSSSFGDFMTQAQPLGGCGITQPQTFVTDDLKKKRLRLLSVNFNGDMPYNFEYSTMPLPYKTSLAKDMWGYFNGALNTTLLPDINNLGYTDSEITQYFREHPFGGYRKANSSYAQGGMLTKIIQPTRGYTKMFYESNVFTTIPGTSALIDVPVSVTDIGNGKDSKEFTVPFIGYDYNAHINVHINCLGPQYGCESGSCLGYSNYSAGVNGTQDNRLYIVIEKKNADGTWSDFKYFDRLSPEMGNNCTFDGYIALPNGTYRITANFPDNTSTGLLGGPWANATIIYKDFNVAPTANENAGGGLRINSVIDYNSETDKYNERYYTYSPGKLITKPDFIYVFDSTLPGINDSFTSTSTCGTLLLESDFNNCSFPSINSVHKETLYSDSILPYSYNAMGVLVGYNQVTISYGQNAFNGKEVYNYINNYDYVFPYPGMLPGVTGVRKPDNGMLSEKYTYRNPNPGISSPTFDVVNYEKYEYEVKDYKKYWNYKPDYHPTTMLCSGSVVASSLNDVSRDYLHFYPIVVGKVRLKRKTEKNYSAAGPETPLETVSVITDYLYNNQHQLISEKFTNSSNEIIEQKTYYPNDLATTGAQPTQMQALVDLNRIDIPVKVEKIVAGEKISEQLTKFISDATTGNLLLPKEIFALKGAATIDPNVTTDRKIIFTKYDTNSVGLGNGNILEYKPDGGSPVSIIWGYNKTQPIAKLENIAFASLVTATITDLQTKSNADNDNCTTPTCNEEILRQALNALRTTYPDALITTYTYDPLIGLTSITDPKGYKVTYEYDALGRLLKVKDKNGNLLTENEYHYKP